MLEFYRDEERRYGMVGNKAAGFGPLSSSGPCRYWAHRTLPVLLFSKALRLLQESFVNAGVASQFRMESQGSLVFV